MPKLDDATAAKIASIEPVEDQEAWLLGGVTFLSGDGRIVERQVQDDIARRLDTAEVVSDALHSDTPPIERYLCSIADSLAVIARVQYLDWRQRNMRDGIR